MPTLSDLRDQARTIATQLDDAGRMPIDREAYAAAGQDPLRPLLGGGNDHSRIGFFGRDPGRDEVKWHEPLIGKGGQSVRGPVHKVLHGEPMPSFAASQHVAEHVFFSNTVPYKPIGNKAWAMAVVHAFRPVIATYLADIWTGEHLITLGNRAFQWFGCKEAGAAQGAAIKAHWDQEDRYDLGLRISWPRPLMVHPLPHPSPLNATWYKRFPGMLETRLRALDLRKGGA